MLVPLTSLTLIYQIRVIGSSSRLQLDPSSSKLSAEQKSALQNNIQLMRDAIVMFTTTGAARGVSGHTGAHTCALVTVPSCL